MKEMMQEKVGFQNILYLGFLGGTLHTNLKCSSRKHDMKANQLSMCEVLLAGRMQITHLYF